MSMRSMLGLVIAAALVALVAAPSGLADGEDEKQPGPNEPQDPSLVKGKRYFDQAVAWINDGKRGVNKVDAFFVDLEDVALDVDGSHTEGYLRLWFASPRKYRQEWRDQKELRGLTTKILNGERGWLIQPSGQVKRLHGTTDAAAVKQLQDDRERLHELTRFLTLEGLEGPGVAFRTKGVQNGHGEFEGKWLTVVRQVAGQRGDVEFFFRFAEDRNGEIRALYPGAVRIRGDRSRGEPYQEMYRLENWKRGPQFRYPTKIRGWSWATPQSEPQLFLRAYPADIRVNPILDDALFEAPSR